MADGRRDGTLNGSGALVALLALAIFIHALDRGNFATAAPLIKDALALSNSQVGVLLSAFYWTYVPGHLLAGAAIGRLGAARTLALGLALWSLATILTGFAGGFASLFALRLLLGVGESTGFPAVSAMLAAVLPEERRTRGNALVGAGLMGGNGMGVLLGGLLLAALGWQALFWLFGGLSLLWLVPWLRVSGRHPVVAPTVAAPAGGPGYRRLLANRKTWAAMFGQFCGNYPYFVILSWLPLYLVKQQGFSIRAMAWTGAAVYLIATLVNLVGGPWVDRQVQKGADVARLRKGCVLVSGVIALGCMMACALGSPTVAVMGLLTYSLSAGIGSFAIFAAGQTLAGPAAAGKWMGLQNGIGGLSGVAGPLLTGVLIDATGDYRVAFLFAAGVLAVGLGLWGPLIGRIEPIDWEDGKG